MTLMKWDPFRELNILADRMGKYLFKDWELLMSTMVWNFLVDIFENDNEVVVIVELFGMNVKDIEVKLENNVLFLKGERCFEKEVKEENYYRIECEYKT